MINESARLIAPTPVQMLITKMMAPYRFSTDGSNNVFGPSEKAGMLKYDVLRESESHDRI